MSAAPLLLLLRATNGQLEHAVDLSGCRIDIGRDNQCEVVLNDPSISRRHCRLYKHQDDGGWRIEDLQSTNGTFVNGRRITDEPKLLALGDEIRCGERAVVHLIIRSQPGGGRSSRGQDSGGHCGVEKKPIGAEDRCLPWALALLSAMLNEESARRRDAEHRMDVLRVQVSRLRELQLRLAAAEARHEEAERRNGEILRDLEDKRQKLRTRERQAEEAQAAIQHLRMWLEQNRRDQAG